ncbi:MAG: hypothetical protein K9L77_01830 [Candidatus Omnitrophica bacterium]|nr:hypothetical protein [Candidatus Omnitrophota bacterium]
MLICLRKKIRAQSTAEYAIFFGIVIAVAIGMQKYLKRGMQGKVKSVTDAVSGSAVGDTIAGTGVTLADEGQYVPYYLQNQDSGTTNRQQTAGKSTTLNEDGSLTRNETQNVGVNAQKTENYSGM